MMRASGRRLRSAISRRGKRALVVVRRKPVLGAAIVQITEDRHARRYGAPELPLADVRAVHVLLAVVMRPEHLAALDEAWRARGHPHRAPAVRLLDLQVQIVRVAWWIEARRIVVLGDIDAHLD